MRPAVVALFLAALLAGSVLGAETGMDFAGLYLTNDGGAQIALSVAPDGALTGRIVWLSHDKDRLDVHNPDPALAQRKVLGMTLLQGFRLNAETRRWEGGTIYDPKSGKTYDGLIWSDPEHPGTLQLKGYVLGWTFLGRSTTWTREQSLRP
jgi:uncharacterized protein (DUF2147 family)